MNCGHSSAREPIDDGFGLLCVGKRAKLWLTPSATARKPLAKNSGSASLPRARAGHCFSDFREAYQLVIPAQQHTAAGKETGFTAHVERWNNTLRQRLGRFVRKSLSFSKSDTMHELCLLLFLHDYNNSLALSRN
jgi:hypothetical protein